MTAKGDLAEFVMDHLSQNATPANTSLAAVMSGLARIFTAYNDAQERRGNWGSMLENLRSGIQLIESALAKLRTHGGPGVASVVAIDRKSVV